MHPRNVTRKMASETVTASEYCERVYHLALYLESKGISARDVGCVFAPNSYHWVHMDLATLLIGAKSAGVYPNSNAKDIQYILNHTECRLLSLKDAAFHKKVLGDGEFTVPARVTNIIVFEGDTSFHPGAVSYDAALKRGRGWPDNRVPRRSMIICPRSIRIRPRSSFTRPGTTGAPKGALLSHATIWLLLPTSPSNAGNFRWPAGACSRFFRSATSPKNSNPWASASPSAIA